MTPSLVEFNRISSTNYSGSLPKCQDQQSYDPGFRFRVDQVIVEKRIINNGREDVDLYDTIVVGANVDANPVCGTMISWNSPKEKITLTPGRTLNFAWRLVQRSDFDVTRATILYDENRRILYALVLGVRPDLFANDLGDLLPGLSLQTASTVICKVPDADLELVSLRLSTNADTCEIDSHSERCCTLWDRTYEVQTMGVLGVTTSQSYPVAVFALRAPGVIVSAP